MLFSTPILDIASVSNNHERGYPKGYGLWAVLPFGIGHGFQGTYGRVHVRMYLSFSILNEFEMHLKNFLLAL